jgi:CRP-like cAMP-binding protein
MAEAPVELLQRVPLFSEFERGDLQRLARSFKERTFPAGSTVANEGKTGAGFFVIESGEASVSVRGADRRQRSALLRPHGLGVPAARREQRVDRMEAPRDHGETAAGRAELSARLSDGQLVARCREGDEDAWRELVDRFSRYVYAIAVQAFRLPQQDAEDVFQEVFARVFERLDSLRDDEAVRPWIAQLTRRLCIDRLRAGAHEADASVDELPETGSEEVLSALE